MATDTLQSIELITTEPRCMAGQTYGLGYRLNPSEYYLKTESGSSRTDIRIFTEVDDPDELILSHEISSWNSRMVNNIRPVVVFKEAVTGTVGVRMCVEDIESGEVVRSNTLILNVYNDPSIIYTGTYGTGGTKQFSPPSNPMLITMTGGAVDCTQYLVTAAERQSKYFYLSTSASCVGIDTDGVTLIPKKAGSGLVWAMTHVAFGSTNTGNPVRYDGKLTKIDSWKSFTVTVYDEAEELALNNAMNLRFKVPRVEVDRSTDIIPSPFDDDPSDYPGVYRDEDGDLNRWLYLNQTYDFHPRDYKDFVDYDDPNGVIDLSRLNVRLENDEGQPILFMGGRERQGYSVATEWAEGSCWLVARYGELDSSKEATYCRIPYVNITNRPDHVPIRYVYRGQMRTDGDTLDWSTWYPASKVIQITPLDATINTFNFSVSSGDEVYYIERIGTEGTLDDQYKVRFAGIGKYGIGCSYTNGGPRSGGTLEIRWGGSSASYPSGHYQPNNITMTPSKTSIKKGKYATVNVTYTPDYNFTLYSNNFATKGWRYKIDDGNWLTKDKVNETGVIEVVCESRIGTIFRNLEGNHTLSVTCCLYWGMGSTGEYFHTDIELLSTTMSASSTPTINAATNNGALIDNQTLTLSGGTVAGWNSSSWRYVDIRNSGLIKTYSPGEVTIYAVTTDGRLAQSTYRVGASGSVTPVEPEPETPIDTTLKEAQDTSDDLILRFSNKSDIIFDSPSSNPVSVDIVKETHNFSLLDVVCTSENPNVATIQGYYNMSNGSMDATITPVGKGSTVVRVVCGAESDVINVSVLDGDDASTPHVTYKNMTGASLNIYEYTRISFWCESSEVFQSLNIAGNKEGIGVDDFIYNDSTHTGSFKVALTDHVSGYVYVKYGEERLVFSIANRFSLKFENIQDFKLGIGATRRVMIYPLDDTVKASSVWVHAQTSNNPAVYVDDIIEGTDNNGKRVFFVPITYRRAGREVLIASRQGDDDIYLDLECEATSIPAQSISFNQNSITINK